MEQRRLGLQHRTWCAGTRSCSTEINVCCPDGPNVKALCHQGKSILESEWWGVRCRQQGTVQWFWKRRSIDLKLRYLVAALSAFGSAFCPCSCPFLPCFTLTSSQDFLGLTSRIVTLGDHARFFPGPVESHLLDQAKDHRPICLFSTQVFSPLWEAATGKLLCFLLRVARAGWRLGNLWFQPEKSISSAEQGMNVTSAPLLLVQERPWTPAWVLGSHNSPCLLRGYKGLTAHPGTPNSCCTFYTCH